MPIFRSIYVVYCCIWCSALGVVAEVLRSRCVVLCTVCKFVSEWDTNLHTVHNTSATTPSAEHHMQQYTTYILLKMGI